MVREAVIMLADGLLGRYKIIKKIGTGGMGEVYLGEDSKLNRKIALKTLPADVGADSERMRRFTREAKSASALNHPNIITIYEINDEDQTPFIAMEYVEGETLGKIIKRSPPELAAAVDIAIQVAGALAAAHEANVVHRDVKPDNIIVRPDGLVKVLDFGLAKLTESEVGSDPEAETVAHRTNPGMIIGTASYMSPEQARGKQVDGRSDIFSFGTVLYQMFTGKLPFVGENYVDVIALVLHQDPPPMADAVPDVPHQIESIVRKCLRKDRDERFQSMRELLADLRDVQQVLGLVSRSGQRLSASSDPGTNRTTGEAVAWPFTTDRHSRFHTGSISKMLLSEVRLHPVRVLTVLTALIAVIGFGGIGLKKLGDVSTAAEAFRKMRFSKITSTGNIAIGQTAIAPKGGLVAYVVEQAGEQSLWVKQASADSNIQIIPPGKVEYRAIEFSPDSAFIYYVKDEINGKASLYQVPALGVIPPRKLIDDINDPFAISPDGRRIAYNGEGKSLILANSDGTAQQTLFSNSDGKRWVKLAWSPDGKKIAAAYFLPEDNGDHLVEISAQDGKEKPLAPDHWMFIRGLAWLPDGSALLVNGRDKDTQLSQLWMLDYPNGEPRRITNDLSDYQGLSLSADGETIASVQQNTLANIWYINESEGESPRKITNELGKHDGMSGIATTPDGSVVYAVKERGLYDLWIVNGDSTEKRQLTFNAQRNFSPVVSSDGRYIVFVSTRNGNADIWRINIDGGNPVQLTDYPGADLVPTLSPDGKWVVYERNDDERYTIWKVSVNGGEQIQLTDVNFRKPMVSPDGKFILCEYGSRLSDTTIKLAIIPFEGGRPVRILDLPSVVSSRIIRWAPDGKSLIYIDSVNRAGNLWIQSLDGGQPRQLTNFTSDRIFRFDVSSDGKHYAISRGNETADVVTITNFR